MKKILIAALSILPLHVNAKEYEVRISTEDSSKIIRSELINGADLLRTKKIQLEGARRGYVEIQEFIEKIEKEIAEIENLGIRDE